jgi:hypothetical protein
MKILLITLCLFPVCFSSVLRKIEWEKISEKNLITVYKPTKYEHSSGLIPIRFQAIIKHNVLKVLSALADNTKKTQWLPNAVEVKELEKKSVSELIVYYRYDAPWPFKDRDFVILNEGKFEMQNMTISVDIKSIKHQKDPQYETTVRAKTFDGYTIIKPHGVGHTYLEMAFLNDFGGFIPKFIVNLVQKKWPYKLMTQLNDYLDNNEVKILPDFQNLKVNTATTLPQ